MGIDETVVVKTYTDEITATMAASRLEAEGVEAFIRKDDCGGAYPSLQMVAGVRLIVKAEDLEAAQRILAEMEAESSGEVESEEQEEQAEETGDSTQSTRPFIFAVLFFVGLFLLGFAIGYIVSPELRYISPFTGVVKERKYPSGRPGQYVHYVNDQMVRIEQDRNDDGGIDAWFYYKAGHTASAKIDNNFDGKPDVWVTYANEFNYVETWDTDFDGKPDATIHFVNGLPDTRDWHPKDSPDIVRKDIFIHGVLRETLTDTNGDGFFDQRTKYDAYEKLIAQEKCHIPTYRKHR